MKKTDVFIIAEIAQAHDGSLGIAHSFIDALKDTGVDAVKFQVHIAEAESSIYEPFRVKFSYEDATRYDYWKRMEFEPYQWSGLKKHCEECGLEFMASVFSNAAVDLLEKLGVKRYKIGSGEVSNLLLLDKIAYTGKPVILSSGMSSYEELLGRDIEKSSKELEIYIPPGPRLGNVVIEANNVSKAYGDNILIEGMTFSLPPGGIIGVIGPNGAGKTTLFRMISGQEKPDSGSFKIGETVRLAYVDQSRDALDPDKTIWEIISGGDDTIQLGKRQVNSRAYVARFNFSGTDQQKKCSMLSGGERNRVHLARMLKEEANVLLLDEPTNDLDINTLRALEEALESFAGCAVVISHDRWFLDRIATHMLAFEGDSKVVWFEGNFSEYEADRKARLGTAANQPHRIKYRHLTRD